MSLKFRVYASMQHSPLHTETSTNAVQYTVDATDAFDALGKANQAGKRCGIDVKAMRYFEITEIRVGE